MQVNAYLFFAGQCEEAFKFYAEVLGGRIEVLMPHEGMPAAEHVPPAWQRKIMHGRMTLGGTTLMASDVPEGNYRKPQGFAMTLGLETPAEAERVFAALSEKGEVRMPMEKTFFAARFGMVTDRFGTPWMVLCEKAD